MRLKSPRCRSLPPALSFVLVLLALAMTACSDDTTARRDEQWAGGCTLELREALEGRVTDAQGRPLVLDRVEASVNGRAAHECETNWLGEGEYRCFEQGGGRYEVTVWANGQSQRQTVELQADECHLLESAQLDFVFERECRHAGDCEVVSRGCCGPCGSLTLDEALARPRGVQIEDSCQGVACGACPELAPPPPTVVPACVKGVCEAVDIRAQDYAQCDDDSDCVLIPVSCCGFCGDVTLVDAFAIRADSQEDYRVCDAAIACPDVECASTELMVEAYCHSQGHCAVRSL